MSHGPGTALSPTAEMAVGAPASVRQPEQGESFFTFSLAKSEVEVQVCLCFGMGRSSSSMALRFIWVGGRNVLEAGFGSMYWTTEGEGTGAGEMWVLCQLDKTWMLLIRQQQGSLSQKLT